MNFPFYRSQELSVDVFGTGSIGQQTIDNIFGKKVERDGRLGAGVGLNYFLPGMSALAAAYTENSAHNFLDSTSANLIGRLPMEWLLKSVIPRLQWPKPVFKDKRAITAEEHAAIVQREQSRERRDFYELLWLTGAAQSDGACLRAEDINWQTRTICFTRKKLK